MQFNWEISFATIFMIAGSALAVIRFWIAAEQKANSAEKRAAEAETQARLAHEKIALLQASINAHQVTQAERLVSREVLREVEERLSRSIDHLGSRFEGLGEKLDSFVKELISHRKGGG
jgi:cytochrome c biogenesis factor